MQRQMGWCEQTIVVQFGDGWHAWREQSSHFFAAVHLPNGIDDRLPKVAYAGKGHQGQSVVGKALQSSIPHHLDCHEQLKGANRVIMFDTVHRSYGSVGCLVAPTVIPLRGVRAWLLRLGA